MTLGLSILFSISLLFTQIPADTETVSDQIPVHFYPTIEATVDRNEMRIGDVFHLTVTLAHDPAVEVLPQNQSLNLGQFEIKDINFGVTEDLPDGKKQRRMIYTLSTYFTGEFEIPPFQIRFRTDDGRMGEISTPSIIVNVVPLTPEESEELDIRGAKPQTVLLGNSRMWFLLTLLILFMMLAILAYAIWRRYKQGDQDELAAPILPPHEQALRDLAALREERELFEQKKYKEFSIRVSEIIRIYIQRRWGISALDETTSEILDHLRLAQIQEETLRLFQFFFDDCDLIKFAKHEPTTEEMENLIQLGEKIVYETVHPLELTSVSPAPREDEPVTADEPPVEVK